MKICNVLLAITIEKVINSWLGVLTLRWSAATLPCLPRWMKWKVKTCPLPTLYGLALLSLQLIKTPVSFMLLKYVDKLSRLFFLLFQTLTPLNTFT